MKNTDKSIPSSQITSFSSGEHFHKTSQVVIERLLTNSHIMSWCIGVIAFLLFFYGVQPEYLTVYDARFALFAKTMATSGITPYGVQYGAPYPDYPSLSILFSYLSSLLMFSDNIKVIMLPNILGSALSVVLIYQLAATYCCRFAIFSALFAMLTIEFFCGASTLGPDQLILLVTLSSVYVHHRTRYMQHMTLYSKAIILLLLMTGFFIRGPIGLIIPASVMTLFYFCFDNIKSTIKYGIYAAITMAVCLLLWLWFAYLQGGAKFMHQVLSMQMLSRFQFSHHPLHKYFINLFSRYSLTYEVAIFSIFGLVYYYWRHYLPFKTLGTDRTHCTTQWQRWLFFLIIWNIVLTIGLAIPSQREVRYIVAIVPTIAMLAAYPFSQFASYSYFHRIRSVVRWASWLIILLTLISISIMNTLFFSKFPYLHYSSMLIMLGSAFVGATLNLGKNRAAFSKDFIALVLLMGVYIVVLFMVINPVKYQLNKTESLVNSIEMLNKPIVFYKINSDSFPLQLIANLRQIPDVAFYDQPEQLKHIQQNSIVIISSRHRIDVPPLPSQITKKMKLLIQQKVSHDEISAWLYRQNA